MISFFFFTTNSYGGMPYQGTLKGFGDFKIGGQIIHTLKYADELVLL